MPHDARVSAKLPERFRDTAAEIQGISGTWNAVEIFTPDPAPLENERAAFLEAFEKGEDYTPTFAYGVAEGMDIGDGPAKLRSLLGSMEAWEPRTNVERLCRGMLRAKVLDDLATCDLLQGIRAKDDAAVGAALDRKYLPLDESLLRYQARLLEDVIRGAVRPLSQDAFATRLKSQTLRPEEEKAFFEWALRSYGLLRTDDDGVGFRVIVDDNAQVLDVRHRSSMGPVIAIPAKPSPHNPFTLYRAVVLLDHEIEAHALQTMNGRVMLGLDAALTLDDETWYEGLAMRRETNAIETYFGATDDDLRFYAQAVRSAEQGRSFAQIFREQYDLGLHLFLRCPLDQPLPAGPDPAHAERARATAWRTAYRVMRGHTDLGNSHAFAMRKDLAYNRGFLLDRELVRSGKGHLNEVAVIMPGGHELLEELGVRPEDIPYPYKNLTADFVRALKEESGRDGAFDILAFVRARDS